MDILISTLEVIITDYAEATEGSLVNGGVDEVISLPTVLYLSLAPYVLRVLHSDCVSWNTVFPMMTFEGFEMIFPVQ
jgi:hypothetical protein